MNSARPQYYFHLPNCCFLLDTAILHSGLAPDLAKASWTMAGPRSLQVGLDLSSTIPCLCQGPRCHWQNPYLPSCVILQDWIPRDRDYLTSGRPCFWSAGLYVEPLIFHPGALNAHVLVILLKPYQTKWTLTSDTKEKKLQPWLIINPFRLPVSQKINKLGSLFLGPQIRKHRMCVSQMLINPSNLIISSVPPKRGNSYCLQLSRSFFPYSKKGKNSTTT